MTENEIEKTVVDAAYQFHRRLGTGLLRVDCRFYLRLCMRAVLFRFIRVRCSNSWALQDRQKQATPVGGNLTLQKFTSFMRYL